MSAHLPLGAPLHHCGDLVAPRPLRRPARHEVAFAFFVFLMLVLMVIGCIVGIVIFGMRVIQ